MKLKHDAISLFNNKTDGSTTLLIKLNRLIKKDIKDKVYIAQLVKESSARFRSFAIIRNYLNDIRKVLNNSGKLHKIIKDIENQEKVVNLKIFENSREYFLNASTLLTLSNSQTILSFLTQLRRVNNKLRVIIAESRPKKEGRILARRLLKIGIKIEYITDFSVSKYIPLIDAAVIGADKVLANHNVVNKTGSRTLAVLCRYYNKPFYVITSRNKLIYEKKYIPEEKDPSEIWKYSADNLTIKNIYFEEVESDLITKIITD